MKLPRHKCGLFLTHNEHRNYYDTIEQAVDDLEAMNGPQVWATDTSRELCLAAGEIWDLHWYPDTPIGSYHVAGATLEEVLTWAAAVEAENV